MGSLSRDMPVDTHRISVSLAKRAVARLRMSRSCSKRLTRFRSWRSSSRSADVSRHRAPDGRAHSVAPSYATTAQTSPKTRRRPGSSAPHEPTRPPHAGTPPDTAASISAFQSILPATLSPQVLRTPQNRGNSTARIDDDHRGLVCRKPELFGPAVRAVCDPLQVGANDLLEMLLPDTHHRQERPVLAALGVVEDQVSSMGVDPLGCERMVEPDLVGKLCDGGSNPLHRDAGLAQRAEDERLREANERDRCSPPSAGKHRNQRLGVGRMRPHMERRHRDVEVPRALSERE